MQARRSRCSGHCLAVALAAVLGGAAPAAAAPSGDMVPGPVPARVLRVIDGDTVEVEARIWLGQDVTVMVRLDGADAPELHGRCRAERDAARAAERFLAGALGDGRVLLRDVRPDKYGGRVLARILAPDGRDLSRALLETGLAMPYAGGARRAWCADGER